MEAVIHDVQLAPPRRSVKDGLVGEGEGHLPEAAGGHEELVGLEELHQRGAFHGERPVHLDLAARAGQARLQALREAVGVASPVLGL